MDSMLRKHLRKSEFYRPYINTQTDEIQANTAQT
ncbi:MAG: hypothetical protein ACI942_003387, partial [Planctomycetota bacterium]